MRAALSAVAGPEAIHLVHHLPLRHHFGGPKIDYIALALAAAVSWVGITGPGEAALIAAAIAAAHGRVDLTGTIAVAWAGAMTGGVAGWLIGLKGGRALLARPGPLYHLRLRLLEHGDDVYARRGWLAVYLAPSWMAGVSAMPARRFLVANAIAALVWALTIGGGAYVAGPPIADAVSDLGLVGIAIAAAVVVISILRRRHRHRRR
jgi:membrane protein DedA with SNARE-associated domain